MGHLVYLMFRCHFDVMESLEEFGVVNTTIGIVVGHWKKFSVNLTPPKIFFPVKFSLNNEFFLKWIVQNIWIWLNRPGLCLGLPVLQTAVPNHTWHDFWLILTGCEAIIGVSKLGPHHGNKRKGIRDLGCSCADLFYIPCFLHIKCIIFWAL